MYCDTSIIAPALDKHFPESQGYPALFPPRKDGGKVDSGMIKALTTFYADRSLFSLASGSLPYKKFPREFIEDRSKASHLGTMSGIIKLKLEKFFSGLERPSM